MVLCGCNITSMTISSSVVKHSVPLIMRPGDRDCQDQYCCKHHNKRTQMLERLTLSNCTGSRCMVLCGCNITSMTIRDQPNSREKMHNFMVDFLKCAKFHGKFMEGV